MYSPVLSPQPYVSHVSGIFLVEMSLRELIISLLPFTERNDQIEQEERREIKQRLTRKVSVSIFGLPGVSGYIDVVTAAWMSPSPVMPADARV